MEYSELINKINDALFRFEMFSKYATLDYQYNGFKSLFNQLFVETSRSENFTYENCKRLGFYWELINQHVEYADKGEFENDCCMDNENFEKDLNEMHFVSWDQIEEFSKFQIDTTDEKTISISDIVNNVDAEFEHHDSIEHGICELWDFAQKKIESFNSFNLDLLLKAYMDFSMKIKNRTEYNLNSLSYYFELIHRLDIKIKDDYHNFNFLLLDEDRYPAESQPLLNQNVKKLFDNLLVLSTEFSIWHQDTFPDQFDLDIGYVNPKESFFPFRTDDTISNTYVYNGKKPGRPPAAKYNIVDCFNNIELKVEFAIALKERFSNCSEKEFPHLILALEQMNLFMNIPRKSIYAAFELYFENSYGTETNKNNHYRAPESKIVDKFKEEITKLKIEKTII